jgi:hypothetical protein
VNASAKRLAVSAPLDLLQTKLQIRDEEIFAKSAPGKRTETLCLSARKEEKLTLASVQTEVTAESKTSALSLCCSFIEISEDLYFFS